MHTGAVGVEFDTALAGSNLRKHGVGFADAEQALRDPFAVTIEEPVVGDQPRFVSLGADSLGRILVVVHTPRGENVRLISARKASRGEASHYHGQEL